LAANRLHSTMTPAQASIVGFKRQRRTAQVAATSRHSSSQSKSVIGSIAVKFAASYPHCCALLQKCGNSGGHWRRCLYVQHMTTTGDDALPAVPEAGLAGCQFRRRDAAPGRAELAIQAQGC